MRRLAAGLLTTVIAGCARHAALPVAPDAVEPERLPGLNVELAWNAPVDLDLYLTDPTSQTVYFGNNPSRSGARLLRDMRCADVRRSGAPFMEQAQVPEPHAGRYRVGVDFIESCGAPRAPVSFRISVELGGRRRETTGTIQLEEFHPIVLEFDLAVDGGDGAVVLREEEP